VVQNDECSAIPPAVGVCYVTAAEQGGLQLCQGQQVSSSWVVQVLIVKSSWRSSHCTQTVPDALLAHQDAAQNSF
jgi:hypothetical protein